MGIAFVVDGQITTKEIPMINAPYNTVKRVPINLFIAMLLLLLGATLGHCAAPTDANGQMLERQHGLIDGYGSFVLYRNCDNVIYALSAGHMVEINDDDATYIGIWNDRAFSLHPEFVDTNLDFAVFSVSDQTLPVTAQASGYHVKSHDTATTVGSYGKRWCPVVINGICFLREDGYNVYDMPGVTEGYSGAGVFNSSGGIVGIVVGINVLDDERTGFAYVVPMTDIAASMILHNQSCLLPRMAHPNFEYNSIYGSDEH